MTTPALGLLDWFHPGEEERVDRVLDDVEALGVRHFRTALSWADWHTPEGEAWYEWLIPRVSARFDVLPCFVFTPPSLGLRPRTNAPPRDPESFTHFVDTMITRFGEHFDFVELWDSPNNRTGWDHTLDPDGHRFAKTIGSAAYWARERGKRVVLGGMSPVDPAWLDRVLSRGLAEHLDVIGIQAYPHTWEAHWDSWAERVADVRDVLAAHGSNAQVWITGTGYSTWRWREREQVREFLDVLEAPVERAYWYAVDDEHPRRTWSIRHHEDERADHFGLRDPTGRPKLLHGLWEAGGVDAVRDAAWLTTGAQVDASPTDAPVLVTGGAGFVGANLAHRLLESGRRVIVMDNLSRPTAMRNARWLRAEHDGRVQFEVADVRNAEAVRRVVGAAGAVYHCAGQVAVTTSLQGPSEDFAINARGTLNVLEALRARDEPIPLVFTSTNKVYGRMPDLTMSSRETRYEPDDPDVRGRGIPESRPLDFHSPYGCSKGAADQYVLDYARTYGLPATVFRMSCIYGPHQFGTEDQGWVAHFLIRALNGDPITIYGDGLQVRDTLFVDDLVRAFTTAEREITSLAGRAFNIGGGPDNTLSLLELLDLIEELQGARPDVHFADWRPGDQPYYVSDISAFEDATAWRPRVSVRDGVSRLHAWLKDALQEPVPSRLQDAHPHAMKEVR